MRQLLFFFVLAPFLLSAQKTQTDKNELQKIYIRAISEFIKAANIKNNSKFDTLFFGKRQYGQPDDFPDIELPAIIENTSIKLISPQLGTKYQNEKPKRIYINLMGWVNQSAGEFIFVVFSNGFKHQYDCTINYSYDPGLKYMALKKITFKDLPLKK